jgi:hypothetical protein
MNNYDLTKKIADLTSLIQIEEENYNAAITMQVTFISLKEKRLLIRKLKVDLQVLLDEQSIL